MEEFVEDEVKSRWKWSNQYEREIEYWKEVVGYIQRSILRMCIRVLNTVCLCVRQMSCSQ